jgi:hypothetical protein
MHFGFRNVTLLHSDYQHVADTHVATLRVVRAKIQMYLLCVTITPLINHRVVVRIPVKW